MNNNEQSSQDKNQSNSAPKLRVERVHGGTNVEEIEIPELMNEPECPHTNMVRDYTETEFIAFMCDNPKCGILKLYNK